MSDPFSVAGGAVGVISLGLQVCSKIVSYTQAVRGQTDDIRNLASKAENIRSSLKQLRELIEETRDDSPDFADHLEAQAFGLKANVEKLHARVEEYKPFATETLQDKAKSTLKKVIYPLKKEALFDIGGCLDGMQATLRTALSM
jgi:ABC-type transporter Mla subunit MlaD